MLLESAEEVQRLRRSHILYSLVRLDDIQHEIPKVGVSNSELCPKRHEGYALACRALLRNSVVALGLDEFSQVEGDLVGDRVELLELKVRYLVLVHLNNGVHQPLEGNLILGGSEQVLVDDLLRRFLELGLEYAHCSSHKRPGRNLS